MVRDDRGAEAKEAASEALLGMRVIDMTGQQLMDLCRAAITPPAAPARSDGAPGTEAPGLLYREYGERVPTENAREIIRKDFIKGYKGLADYLDVSVSTIRRLKIEGVFEGTYRSWGRSRTLYFNKKAVREKLGMTE